MGKQRFVVKIGTSSLTEKNGRLSLGKISFFAGAISDLKHKGHDVVLISSGAVAAGFTKIGYPARPVTIRGKQASAAVGQNLLMQAYAEAFKKKNHVSAQLLLTRHDFLHEDQYRNAFNTIDELLKRHVVPIINENDSTAVDELTFGDNDMLSALVSGFIHADRLIIITDVDGLYNDNPLKNPDAKKYHHLTGITEDMMSKAEGSGSKVGTGGMKSKLEAVKTAHGMGVSVFLGKGDSPSPLLDIISGNGNGTYVDAGSQKTMKNMKQWLAYHSLSKGSLTIDDGAAEAVLNNGKSLLPAGIVSLTGHFASGDVVDVYNKQDELLGRGKVAYDVNLLEDVMASRSGQYNEKNREAIHRDQWLSLKRG